MQLRMYLQTRRRSARDLAEKVGCSEARISQILGGGDLSADLARRIHAATGGLVTPNDLMGVSCDCGGDSAVAEVAQEAGEAADVQGAADVDDVVHGRDRKRAAGARQREVLSQ